MLAARRKMGEKCGGKKVRSISKYLKMVEKMLFSSLDLLRNNTSPSHKRERDFLFFQMSVTSLFSLNRDVIEVKEQRN